MATSVSRRSPSAVHPTRQQLDDLDALLKRMLELPVNRLEDESDENESSSQAEEEVRPPTAPPASEPKRGPHRLALIRPQEQAAAAPVQYSASHSEEADLKPRVIIVAPNSPDNETKSAPVAPHKTAEERLPGDGPEDWVPLTSSWRPSSRTWKPLTEAWEQAQGGNGLPVVEKREEARGRRGEEEKRARGEEENEPSPFAEIASPLPPLPSSPLPVVPLSSPQSRPTQPAPAPEWTPWYIWPFVGFNAVFDVFLWPWGPIGRWLRGPTGRALLGILGLLCLTAALALAAADWIGWTS